MSNATEHASEYAFTGAPEIDAQLKVLQGMLDPITKARLASLDVKPGARAWEIGAGGGSIARHLAELVGPEGSVVATDLDTSRVDVPDGVEVLVHDVRTDELPGDGRLFDVIHARYVIMHIAERREILARLAGALAPGGWLLVEDAYCPDPLRVMTAPDDEAAATFRRFSGAMFNVMREAGSDTEWAYSIHQEMRALGLQDVQTVIHTDSTTGGAGGSLLHDIHTRQLREQLKAQGLTQDDLDAVSRIALDPAFSAMWYETVSTFGRKA
ncbi:methyltransferase [Yinghuangia seranimata]|uniref:methyltransferase n=1 Tax=Yinghuangia seranimata TaxID=408067 RepID=UPI00248D0468|nr:methyltransferase [Yinghuangia seranimata]MDI2129911.1 methyltransferase [Yinghuangia seranimata]